MPKVHPKSGRLAVGQPKIAGEGLFLRAHLRQQVVDTLVHRLAPVFIDVKPAVAVQVLELQAIDNEDRFDAGLHHRRSIRQLDVRTTRQYQQGNRRGQANGKIGVHGGRH